MGLILSRQIVQKYNGKLDFSSEFQKGSTFVFSYGIDIVDEDLQNEQPKEDSPRFAARLN